MPLANRVDPFGALFATPERGLLFGNRGGRFHDPATQTVRARPYASRQWICCSLSFRGRQRKVWSKGYTELFFSDEAAALAAGHRPCFECRREDAMRFAAAWAKGHGLDRPPKADEMDRVLDAERRIGRAKRLHRLPLDGLPDGTMVVSPDGPAVVMGDLLQLWRFSGPRPVAPRPPPSAWVDVLTPPAAIACLRAGYGPLRLAAQAHG